MSFLNVDYYSESCCVVCQGFHALISIINAVSAVNVGGQLVKTYLP